MWGNLASNSTSWCRDTDNFWLFKSQIYFNLLQVIHASLWSTKWDETPPSFYSGVTFCSWHANQLACPFARFLASLLPIQSIVFVSLLHIEGLSLLLSLSLALNSLKKNARYSPLSQFKWPEYRPLHQFQFGWRPNPCLAVVALDKTAASICRIAASIVGSWCWQQDLPYVSL